MKTIKVKFTEDHRWSPNGYTVVDSESGDITDVPERMVSNLPVEPEYPPTQDKTSPEKKAASKPAKKVKVKKGK